MGSEGGVLLEALPAVGAAEGPLLCVNPLMHEAIGAGLKRLPTHRTHIGPLTGVGTLVSDEMGVLRWNPFPQSGQRKGLSSV